ncbi:MAG: TorD/DmsD family molecular chaperone [Thermoleophilia bacterium]
MPGDQHEAGEGQRSEDALARAGICRLLARVFSAKPSPELVAGLKEARMLEVLASLGVDFDDDFIEGDAGEQAEALAVEFTRLFVGPGQHIAAYESVFVRGYAEDEARLWGEATGEVEKFYREAGLEVETAGEIPDHIGIELEAMAELAAAEAARRDEGAADEASRLWALQQQFAREHLARWLPEFCRTVVEQADSEFYRGMAALVGGLDDLYETD